MSDREIDIEGACAVHYVVVVWANVLQHGQLFEFGVQVKTRASTITALQNAVRMKETLNPVETCVRNATV